MNKTCRPIPRKGERNVFCPFYDHCLTHAINESWRYWNCGGCQHKLDQGARPELRLNVEESIEYYELRLNL